MELLNPEKANVLKNAYIVCELHDFIVPKITGELIGRFQETHVIDIIYETAKISSNYRILNYLEEEKDKDLAIAEFRQINAIPDQGRWIILKPKN